MVRRIMAVLATLGLTAAIGLAAGCGGSDEEAAKTPANSPTVANSAPQTDSAGKTVTAPSAGSTGTAGGGGADTSGGGGGGGGGGAPVVQIDAAAQGLAFDKKTATAKAGMVTLKMDNPSPLQHNIALKKENKVGETVGQGGTSEITVDLKPGTYEYYCAVPGHEQAGMKGTLTVK